MLPAEAKRICELVLQFRASPLLNVGSSSAAFRTTERSHMETLLFAELRDHGIAVDHLDLKAGDGIDIVGDILDPRLRHDLAGRGYRGILLANVLEHVRDRAGVATACEEILGSGGLIIATAPASYPYHADPIDTGYRPSPGELAALFSGSRANAIETIAGPTYAGAMRASGHGLLGEAAGTLRALLLAPLRPRSARSRLHRWLWYRRPYRVSLAQLAVL